MPAERMVVALRHRVGGLAVDAAFRLDTPWTVLFGPSGAGKTTVLRAIAGLIRPDAGRVTASGVVLVDTAAKVGVPAHRRGVRYVGQKAALFPHLDVLGNVRYGAGRSDVGEVLELCRVGHLTVKMPGMLSGGERQRVALARALAAGVGRAVLLDEPFSGLDVRMREELIGDLRAWLGEREATVLQVTHDVGEVFPWGRRWCGCARDGW